MPECATVPYPNGSITVGKRRGAKRLQAKGIFPGAKVERGFDWKYGDQDGGEGGEGMVKKITNWKNVQRGAAIVSWDGARKGSYRLGFNGKVSDEAKFKLCQSCMLDPRNMTFYIGFLLEQVNCESKSCELRVASYELRVAVASRALRVASCELQLRVATN